MYVHTLHTVHALPDLRVAGGRLGDGVSVLMAQSIKRMAHRAAELRTSVVLDCHDPKSLADCDHPPSRVCPLTLEIGDSCVKQP